MCYNINIAKWLLLVYIYWKYLYSLWISTSITVSSVLFCFLSNIWSLTILIVVSRYYPTVFWFQSCRYTAKASLILFLCQYFVFPCLVDCRTLLSLELGHFTGLSLVFSFFFFFCQSFLGTQRILSIWRFKCFFSSVIFSSPIYLNIASAPSIAFSSSEILIYFYISPNFWIYLLVLLYLLYNFCL